jgi:hypothetical protein
VFAGTVAAPAWRYQPAIAAPLQRRELLVALPMQLGGGAKRSTAKHPARSVGMTIARHEHTYE